MQGRCVMRRAAWMMLALLVGCGGCSRDGGTPSTRSTPAPVVVTQGKVTLGHMHHRPAPRPDAEDPLAWTDAQGAQWEVTRLYVVVSAVELHLCEPTRAALLWDALVPSAHAHVPDAATRLGTPFIEELVGRPGRARIVGEVAPPLADVCEVVVVIAPADADVMNDTELDAEALLGHSLILQGRRRPAPDQPWAPFTLSAAVTDAWTARAINPKTGDAPLRLRAGSPDAFVLLEKTLGAEDLGGLSEAALKDRAARDVFAADLLKRLGRTISVRRSKR